MRSGLEVIKLEFIFRLKIKRNDWLLADTCPQAVNHCALFESETVLQLYNLEAWSSISYSSLCFLISLSGNLKYFGYY